MRLITKHSLFSAGLLLVLLCLHGCMQSIPILTITTNPTSIHPPGNVTITAVCSQEGGTYTLAVEGEDPVESTEGVFVATVDGWLWFAIITWTDGDSVAETAVRVALENETVVPHGLWTEPNNYPDQGLVLIDLRYLEHGCLNGMPVSYTGFEDPDGDTLWYRVLVEDMKTGEWESVFYGPDRTLMGDEYVSGPIFYWFVNHTGEGVIYQYGVWSPLGCVPTPSLSPGGGSATREKRVHIYILEVECGVVTHWAYDIVTAQPGCSP
jgi:hypothetical protein